MAESVDGIAVIKSLGRQDAEIQRFREANDRVQDQQHAVFARVSRFGPTIQFLTQVNLVVLLIYGGYLTSIDRLQLGSGLIVFAGLLQQFSNQVGNLSGLAGTIQQSLTGARRVFEVLDAAEEVAAPLTPWIPRAVRGEITFQGVWFEYVGGSPVLSDISLQIRAGEKVAVMGAVGQGKSTLLSLVPRFYDPQCGVVEVDGVDVRQWDLKTLRRSVGLVLMRSAQLPALAWSIGAVINGPITGKSPTGTITIAALGVLLLAGLTQLTLVYRQRLALELGEAIIHDLRATVYAHLQRMPMSFFTRTKTGRVISRITSDCDAVRSGVQDVLFVSLVQGGQMIIAAAVMAWYDLPLLMVVLAISPIVWLIGRVMRNRLSQAYRDVQESFSRVTATIAESVAVIRVTQALAREETNADMFRRLTVDHAEYNMNSAREGGRMMPLLELTGQISIGLVLIVGGYRAIVAADPMPVGDLIQFWFLAGLFFSPIQVLGNQYNQALTAMAGAERVFALLDTPPQWSDLADAKPIPTPIRGVTTASMARAVSVVPQQNYLFSGTVMENILAGRIGATVDTLTEVRIQRALGRLLKNRTSLVIAHRLSTIRNADQILVLSAGEVVQRGRHAELLEHAGPYRRLHDRFVAGTVT